MAKQEKVKIKIKVIKDFIEHCNLTCHATCPWDEICGGNFRLILDYTKEVANALTDEDRLRAFVDEARRYPGEPVIGLLEQHFPELHLSAPGKEGEDDSN